MSKSQKLISLVIVVVVIVLVVIGVYFWKKYQAPSLPSGEETPAAVEKISMPKKEPPASFGAQIYEQVKNPVSDMPKTNPFEAKTNPFEGVKINPFEDIYKNPF